MKRREVIDLVEEEEEVEKKRKKRSECYLRHDEQKKEEIPLRREYEHTKAQVLKEGSMFQLEQLRLTMDQSVFIGGLIDFGRWDSLKQMKDLFSNELKLNACASDHIEAVKALEFKDSSRDYAQWLRVYGEEEASKINLRVIEQKMLQVAAASPFASYRMFAYLANQFIDYERPFFGMDNFLQDWFRGFDDQGFTRGMVDRIDWLPKDNNRIFYQNPKNLFMMKYELSTDNPLPDKFTNQCTLAATTTVLSREQKLENQVSKLWVFLQLLSKEDLSLLISMAFDAYQDPVVPHLMRRFSGRPCNTKEWEEFAKNLN